MRKTPIYNSLTLEQKLGIKQEMMDTHAETMKQIPDDGGMGKEVFEFIYALPEVDVLVSHTKDMLREALEWKAKCVKGVVRAYPSNPAKS